MTRRERLEAKVAKRRAWAALAAQRSDARFDAVHRLADSIPLGQPILVGHHSERRARRDVERIHDGMSKACELADLAQHHVGKAAGLERQLDSTIFSDDPDAVEALEAKAAALEAKRDRMKAVNKAYKRGDAAALAALGEDLERMRSDLAAKGPYWGSAPHLPYELTNLGATIRTARKRIEDVKARQARLAAAEAAGGATVQRTALPDGGEWIRLTFAERPEWSVIEALKAAGFRWGGGSWHGRGPLPAEAAEAAGVA